MSIQRYQQINGGDLEETDDGYLVTYDDHLKAVQEARDRGYGEAMDDGWGEPGHIKAAVAEAEQRVTESLTFPQMAAHSYNKGRSDALDKAREAVGGLTYPEVRNVIGRDDALAAIDALKGQS